MSRDSELKKAVQVFSNFSLDISFNVLGDARAQADMGLQAELAETSVAQLQARAKLSRSVKYLS
jgi:hypothetical protein